MAARAEAMQNRPEELPVKTGEIIQSVADATPDAGEAGQAAACATEKPTKKPFQVVRGWTSRNKAPVQYRKLTDADLNTIIFKFVLPKDDEGKERMPADIKDILDAHKRYPETGEPTGLHFENSKQTWEKLGPPQRCGRPCDSGQSGFCFAEAGREARLAG